MSKYKELTDSDEFRIAKPFMAIAGGNAAFFLLFFAITPILVKMGITPYGEFINAFFEGRSMEEASAYIKANQSAYEEGLRQATWFINVMLTPVLALVLGITSGGIMGGSKGLFGTGFGAGLISFIAIIPALMQLLAKSWGDPMLSIFLFAIIFSAVLGGILGNHFVYPFFKNMSEDMERRR